MAFSSYTVSIHTGTRGRLCLSYGSKALESLTGDHVLNTYLLRASAHRDVISGLSILCSAFLETVP